MDKKNILYTDESVKKYLYNLRKSGKIFDAGRGWYSNLSDPFVLDANPIKDIITLIKHKFPLLPFSCWSTEQLKSYYHHLQTKFVTFIYSDSDYMANIADFLKEHKPKVILNPTRSEINKSFQFEANPFIIRPSISKAPTKEHRASIEKILVDLYIENKKLFIMGDWDYHNTLKEIISNHRISVATLIKYSKRRKVSEFFLTKISDV
ncbi:MAG: hypothetical protein A2Y94_02010 [Caldithrix sp. RBG_13_44_9]|nr:MAG: hypothetical protein A2Y94_02010 [Caldithrix sp. RBG_13_44_9]